MSKYLLLGCILLIGIASLGVNATITFPHDTEQCLGQLVEYQCTMTGTGFLSLTWRILDDNGIENDSIAYTSTANGVNTIIGEGIFTVEQLQQSPLISNISFTVQSSINGYTIVCEDSIISMNNENLTINIAGPPQPPTDITDLSCTANTTVEVTWTPPSYSSQCITGYTIINTTTNNSIINTTDTSTSIVLTGLSVGIYCISIASIDTANRIGTYSQQECFQIIGTPPAPDLDSINIVCTNTTAEVTWTQSNYSSQYCSISGYTINTTSDDSTTTNNTNVTSLSLSVQSEVLYRISIASIDTASRIGTYSASKPFELTVPSEPTIEENFDAFAIRNDNASAVVELSWTFDSSAESCIELEDVYLNVSNESNYTITKLSTNISEYNITILREVNYTASIFGVNILGNGISGNITIFIDADDPLNGTTTTTSSPSTKGNFPIVAVVVPVVIVIIIILTVVTLILALVIYKKKRSEQKPHPSSNTNKGSSIQMKPTGGNKQDTPPDQTLYADLEVSTSKPPPSSSKKNVKPSTVEYSPVKHGVEYTELSHSQPVNRVGKKPDTIEPVNYSAVSHR